MVHDDFDGKKKPLPRTIRAKKTEVNLLFVQNQCSRKLKKCSITINLIRFSFAQ